MRRFFAAVIAVAVAIVPIAGDTCGLSCDFDRPAPVMATGAAGSCPLHAGADTAGGQSPRPVPLAPSRCGHDHSTARVALLRASGSALPLTVSADAPPFDRPVGVLTAVFRLANRRLTGPPPISRSRVLRV